jgi:hypothetical protein
MKAPMHATIFRWIDIFEGNYDEQLFHYFLRIAVSKPNFVDNAA